jgi:aspartokinase/homoserine dehydrogenase 1
MKVLKFGGTSVGKAESIRAVAEIIASQNRPVVAVFSALSGITDKLAECLEYASAKNNMYLTLLDEIEERHATVTSQLLKHEEAIDYLNKLKELKNKLKEILDGISTIGEVTLRSSDLVLGFGEQFSIHLLYTYLSKSLHDVVHIDSRNLIFTKLINGAERLEADMTQTAIKEKLRAVNNMNKISVTSGFVASSVRGYPTTLGRGGSDYTAAIIAAALDAEILEIWTDVSGIYTANPAYTDDAYPIPELSYAEALELSHFGARVIYPLAIEPVMRKRIPVAVKNTFARSDRGTMISDKVSDNGNVIKAVSSVDEICLVSLNGSGMAGVAGIASRMFTSLARNDINVILITQASSEQSICIAIEQKLGDKACEALSSEFEFEIQAGRVRSVTLEKGYSILVLVGEGMKYSVGISGQAFSALGRNGINIHAIAQGSSELNISAVIKKQDCRKAVNAIHQEFFHSINKVINLFIVGTGKVGSALVEQIFSQSEFFADEYQTDFRIVGLANSSNMLIRKKGIREKRWKEEMEKGENQTDLEKFVGIMFDYNLPNSVFIDNTANNEVTFLYERVLSHSISVVTCNKIAASSSYDKYISLKKAAVHNRAQFRFETNVGAGLPVIRTIDHMVKTGDRLNTIEAVLSGSLNFIFNGLCNGMKFSEAVKKAVDEGYTEPDPLIDMKGLDIARKLLILVREAGMKLEAEDIIIEDYLPHPLPEKYDRKLFYNQMKDYDPYFDNLRERVLARDHRLRVIGKFEGGNAIISLMEINRSHPFFSLEGNDNIVAIMSKRYYERPLIIKGAGAGADVTASGIFADILSIFHS